MKTLSTNWNLFRLIRLLLGVALVIKGASDGEALFALAGGFIALVAVTNIGCCGSEGCAVPKSSVNTSSTEQKNISYEEVDHTK